jgi:hypothetical protein
VEEKFWSPLGRNYSDIDALGNINKITIKLTCFEVQIRVNISLKDKSSSNV